MNIVLLHPFSPGQFEYLIAHLAENPSNHIIVLCRNEPDHLPDRVSVRQYTPDADVASPFDVYLREAEGVYRGLRALEENDSFKADMIIGHSGWGGLLYTRAACPQARIVGYFEWYHRMTPEFRDAWFLYRTPQETSVLITQRNAGLLAEMDLCDAMIVPTKWQQSVFPKPYRPYMQVIHEGIDTDYYCPAEKERAGLRETLPDIREMLPELSAAGEIISYVSRGLEPTRCFPLFMDAIRIVLSRRPNCHVVIAGSDRTYYGSQPPEGKSWKQREIEKGGFDPERVHFTGWISRENYRALLRASTVHVYLTLPFVLSWSPLQAMSAGCCLVASATAPVNEVIVDGRNGLLIEKLTPEGTAEQIEEALDDPALRERIGRAARETILENYKLEDCLKKQTGLLFGEEDVMMHDQSTDKGKV